MILPMLIKSGAFVTAILAMATIGISSWALQNSISHELDTNFEKNKTILQETTTETQIELNQESTEKNIGNIKLKNIPEFLILISTSTAIFAAIFQLVFSLMIICISSKNLRKKLKLWQLSNFTTLILLTVAILVPLSYSVDKESFMDIRIFFKRLTKRLSYLALNTTQFHLHSFLTHGLNAYYSLLILNCLTVFVFLPFTCLCLKVK